MFESGQSYRRKELHDTYGGQRQGGISTPRDHPLIFLITGASGTHYGYNDAWEQDGSFRYFGEGQAGDMVFERGNRAIRDHARNGRELHLFLNTKKGFLRYIGEMTCGGYTFVKNAQDVNGHRRQAIAFQLIPVDSVNADANGPPPGAPSAAAFWTQPLAALRRAALEAPDVATSRDARVRVWVRSSALRAYVRRRANGACEGCDTRAPFLTAKRLPYLEAHHTRRLSDGGPDDPRWVIALCPTCHRRAHYAGDAHAFNEELKLRLAALEPTS